MYFSRLGKTTVIEEDWKDEEDDDLIDFKLDLEGDEEQEQGNWTARNGDNFGERDNRKKHW